MNGEVRRAGRLSTFALGGVEVRPERNELTRDSKTVHIHPKAMDLLVFLADHRDRVVAKDEILRHVWSGRFVTDHVLCNCVWELRAALGDSVQHPLFIETVPRRGYQLIAALEPRSSRAAPDGRLDGAMPTSEASTAEPAGLHGDGGPESAGRASPAFSDAPPGAGDNRSEASSGRSRRLGSIFLVSSALLGFVTLGVALRSVLGRPASGGQAASPPEVIPKELAYRSRRR